MAVSAPALRLNNVAASAKIRSTLNTPPVHAGRCLTEIYRADSGTECAEIAIERKLLALLRDGELNHFASWRSICQRKRLPTEEGQRERDSARGMERRIERNGT